MRSLQYILYYRLRKRKLHSRFVVWAGCVTFLRAATKTFWNRNWSILREVLYWRLRCVIDQDRHPIAMPKTCWRIQNGWVWEASAKTIKSTNIASFQGIKSCQSLCASRKNTMLLRLTGHPPDQQPAIKRVAPLLWHHKSSYCSQSSLAWPS